MDAITDPLGVTIDREFTLLRWTGHAMIATSTLLEALFAAWRVTVLSVGLLAAAHGLWPIWDSGIFVHALVETLNDPSRF